jgi:hypothetical protein
MGRFNHFIYALPLLLNCCVEPYNIASIGSQELLVVEGHISTDLKKHEVVISRTSPISNQEFVPESNAQVYIKDGHGVITTLTESQSGHYLTPTFKGLIGTTYQLFITTQSGRQVTSDEVTLMDTPEIKNIYASYSPNLTVNGESGGFQIFLDTEDPTKKTNFYRWNYEGTWEIQTPFESNFVWLGENKVGFRDTPVSTCYASESSNSILLQSTQGLTTGKVTAQVIQTLSASSPSMRIAYSILVRQYAISQHAFLYWQNLKKINQSQGTLYDTQPGIVIGNIKSLNDKEAVLGYFDAGVVKEVRVFFRAREFRAAGYTPPGFLDYCLLLNQTKIPDTQIGEFLSQNKDFEIIGATGIGPSTLYLLPKQCCNCTSLGTNIKPAFWP